jgi:hypothetical protein
MLLISRLASVLGWDALYYDTWPNKRFNIWHFPPDSGWRGPTRHVRPNYTVEYVSPSELGLVGVQGRGIGA